MAGRLWRIREDPKTIEGDGIQLRISGDFVAFGLEGAPVFATDGGTPGRVVEQLPDSDGKPLAEGEWSPSVRLLPAWVEFDFDNHRGGPGLHCRVELRDDVPRLVELGWRAMAGQREIRQKDLRDTEVAALVNTVYGTCVFEMRDMGRDQAGTAIRARLGEESEQWRAIRGFLHDVRAGRRHVNAELLQQVAEVYRANIDKAPAEAVSRTFGVKQRMAHEYVRRARERGFLPPTTQGKKKA